MTLSLHLVETFRRLKERKTFFRLLLVCLVAVVSSAVFLALNKFDNKYSDDSPQAINGILYMSSEEADSDDIRFLIDGWEFYPDRLLTPGDLADSFLEHEVRYVSVGQYGTFSMGDQHRPGLGKGTYAMTLMLPEEPRLYTMSLPEVYSAYRLYVNYRQIAGEGNPDPNEYSDATKERQVSFWGSGKMVVLIAVSNYSSPYSGVVYPPALGSARAIESMVDLRIFIGSAVFSFVVIAAIGSLLLSVFSRKARPFSLLSSAALACSIPCVSAVVLHSLATLPVQPWHAIEALGLYATLGFIVALVNRACAVGRRQTMVSNIAAASLFAAIAIAYLLALCGAPFAMTMLSYSTDLFKIATALYLLKVSWDSRDLSGEGMPFMLLSVVFATALVWDRVFSSYEPIVGGWFSAWAMLFFCLGVMLIEFVDLLKGYLETVSLRAQRRSMGKQLSIQEEYLERMKQQEFAERALRHDFRQHLRVVSELARTEEFEKLQEYVGEMEETPVNRVFERMTANLEVDALLQHYKMKAEERNVRFDTELSLPDDLGISPVDAGIILGNALENALDAAIAQAKGCRFGRNEEPFVFVGGQIKNGNLVFLIKNSHSGEVVRSGKAFVSTKRKGLGIGTESIATTARRLDGMATFDHTDSEFKVIVTIPVDID